MHTYRYEPEDADTLRKRQHAIKLTNVRPILQSDRLGKAYGGFQNCVRSTKPQRPPATEALLFAISTVKSITENPY